ncbi:MAG: SDR family NAD(P)-dependent oxidoreductase [Myxococcales bacterium]|jgi:NAD(P)-dependent dehydrogenase (short-subunit alcohol dehydrogenase family)|nr:SDR family NAD(P)-dependent oxidoreductase [Myxococcales bacterium]
MTKRFDGKVAWITGGGSGIGRALALELARRGAKVAVSGRRRDRLDEVVSAIEAQGGEGLAAPCDVTDEASLVAAKDAILARFGKLDVVVANAGFGVTGRLEEIDAAAWRRQLETNVVGVGSTIHVTMPELRRTRGQMVIVASAASLIWAPESGPYCASKAAARVIGYTLAAEMHGTGVAVTTIHPGFVESEIARVDNEGVFDPSRKDHRPQKLMWPTERAARVMADAIAKRKREYVFTAHGKLGAFFGTHFSGLVYWALTRFRLKV